MAAILNSSNQPITSGNIGSVIDVSGLVAYVGTAVEVVTPALCAIVISTSCFGGRHFEFCSRPTSGNVDSVIFNSDKGTLDFFGDGTIEKSLPEHGR